MAYENSLLSVVLKGAAAGLVGTAVLAFAPPRALVAFRVYELVPPEVPVPRSETEAPEAMGKPPRKPAGKVATGVLETSLPEESEQTVGEAIHWGYGAAWGALYGLFQGSVRGPFLLTGLIFGSLIEMVASTAVPAAGLTNPPARQPAAMNATYFALHLFYGGVTALAFHLLGGDS